MSDETKPDASTAAETPPPPSPAPDAAKSGGAIALDSPLPGAGAPDFDWSGMIPEDASSLVFDVVKAHGFEDLLLRPPGDWNDAIANRWRALTQQGNQKPEHECGPCQSDGGYPP